MRFVIRYAVTNALRLLRETLPLLLLTAAVSLGITVSTALERQSEAVYAEIESRYETAVSLFYSPVFSQSGRVVSETPRVTCGLIADIADDPDVRTACFRYVYDSDTPWMWQINFTQNRGGEDVVVSGMEAEPVVFIGVTEYEYADAPAIVQGRALHASDGVTDGRIPVVIPQAAADEKGVTVGDTLRVAFPQTDSLLDREFAVVGICEDDADAAGALVFYIPLSSIEEAGALDAAQEIFGNVRFLLRSPGAAADFIRRAETKWGELPLAMEADDYAYKREVYPASTALALNRTIRAVSLAAGCVLIVILNLILIRVRRRELMVLCRIGCTRLPVTLAYILEKALVSITGAAVGYGLVSVLTENGRASEAGGALAYIGAMLLAEVLSAAAAAFWTVYHGSGEVE